MKRVVCLLLIPTVLLAQWAGFGHCHTTGQADDHACKPHFHLPIFRLTTSASEPVSQHHHHDGHHHGSGHHHHHHGDDEQPNPKPTCPDERPTDPHDENAVYLPAGSGFGLPNDRIGNNDNDDGAWTKLFALPPSLQAISEPRSCRAHPPPVVILSACPTYLRICTLLI